MGISFNEGHHLVGVFPDVFDGNSVKANRDVADMPPYHQPLKILPDFTKEPTDLLHLFLPLLKL
ncbi:MAG: hypothetical protein ACK4SL_00680 [Candidatus Paceibacteria bacterium]